MIFMQGRSQVLKLKGASIYKRRHDTYQTIVNSSPLLKKRLISSGSPITTTLYLLLDYFHYKRMLSFCVLESDTILGVEKA
jgi:hypothetical protein